jgi:hypothetical protein
MATRLVALSAALITLILMIYMAQPWGANSAYQNLSGYAWLLGFAVWATLPYVVIIFLAGRALQSQAHKLLVVISAFLISLGGVALYIDAAFLHRDPQGALVFIAVPLYQWIILGLLTGCHFFLNKKQAS